MSESYPAPITSYDIHVYYNGNDESDTKSALALRQRLIDTFPDADHREPVFKPIGPHPTCMFEVDVHKPGLFGVIVPWVAIHHGPHSVLVHPQTGDELKDHTIHAIWIGDKVPLLFDRLNPTK